ncbi:DDE_3 domain-containing protein [Trichonephila clavipes]|nr:DDE_3 domain-containing protein [Trichonephila clavipes]
MQKQNDLSDVQKDMIIGFRIGSSHVIVVKVYRAWQNAIVQIQRRGKFVHHGSYMTQCYWARTRDNASHDPIPIPLGYCGHHEWFEKHQVELTVLSCTANLPDLSPIENMWAHLDRLVRTVDTHPRNLGQLAMALESAWRNMPVNTFRNLIDSLYVRLAAVLYAEDGFFYFLACVSSFLVPIMQLSHDVSDYELLCKAESLRCTLPPFKVCPNNPKTP